ncbi:MAG TPA: hypothetical protein VJ652_09820 [Noviherbaspirillum sp.]|nr:hypothetical protein [Noviherbaspirillum sp.]
MNIDLKRRLAFLPVLLCAATASATEPVLLNVRDMDRITAGSEPVWDRLTDALKAVQKIRADLGFSDFPVALEGQYWITQLAAGEPASFQRTASGELMVTKQLQNGEQLVILKQPNVADAAAVSQLSPGDTVITRILQPGETIRIQQTGSGGTSYLSVEGTGGTAVKIFQQHL